MTNTAMPNRFDTFDVIKLMLTYLYKYYEKEHTLPADPAVLHQVLHTVVCKRAYAKYFNYIFDEQSYFFPFCREFQTDLINLEMSGYLMNPNPSFDTYHLKEKLVSNFEDRAKSLFDAPDLEAIEAMAKEFCEMLKTKAS